jgi:hypothetical protein
MRMGWRYKGETGVGERAIFRGRDERSEREREVEADGGALGRLG